MIPENASFEVDYTARELRYLWNQQFGVTPEIVSGGQEQTGDIIVGRSDVMPTGDAYSITVSDARMYVSAGSVFGYEAAVEALRERLSQGGLSNTHSLSGDGSGKKTALSRTGQARFMTYNVYGWNEGAAASIRQDFQLSMFSSYQPDILALQEFRGSYRNDTFLQKLGQLGYTEVNVGTVSNSDANNYTPLFYKANAFTVEDSGYLLYSDTNKDDNSKSVTWAVLKHTNGEKLIAVSTHFTWNDSTNNTTEECNAKRLSNARQLLQQLAEIRTEHGDLPIVVGGDFNCRFAVDADPLNLLKSGVDSDESVLLEGGLQGAQDVANNAGKAVNNFGGHNGTFASWDAEFEIFTNCPAHNGKDAQYAIDHIWLDGGMTLEAFATVIDRFASFSSDHSPKIMDFSFN